MRGFLIIEDNKKDKYIDLCFVDVTNFEEESLSIYSHEVLEKIKNNESGWEKLLPKAVGSKIKKYKLFGYN